MTEDIIGVLVGNEWHRGYEEGDPPDGRVDLMFPGYVLRFHCDQCGEEMAIPVGHLQAVIVRPGEPVEAVT
jgi:hypothetical protein